MFTMPDLFSLAIGCVRVRSPWTGRDGWVDSEEEANYGEFIVWFGVECCLLGRPSACYSLLSRLLTIVEPMRLANLRSGQDASPILLCTSKIQGLRQNDA